LEAKLEQVHSARARRYVFHPDEVAEAEAQGLPYVLVPRVCSSGREWTERYAEHRTLNRTHFAYRIDLWSNDEKTSSSIWPMSMTSRLRWRPTMPPANALAGQGPQMNRTHLPATTAGGSLERLLREIRRRTRVSEHSPTANRF
jgi:hypothetical protein